MKKQVWIMLFIILFIALIIFSFVYFSFGNIHNNSDDIKKVVRCAKKLYEEKKQEGMNFSSQCLGVCYDYAVDIVHVPRSREDNLPENQCEEYRKGIVKHFIELDKDGNVVRIV